MAICSFEVGKSLCSLATPASYGGKTKLEREKSNSEKLFSGVRLNTLMGASSLSRFLSVRRGRE